MLPEGRGAHLCALALVHGHLATEPHARAARNLGRGGRGGVWVQNRSVDVKRNAMFWHLEVGRRGSLRVKKTSVYVKRMFVISHPNSEMPLNEPCAPPSPTRPTRAG